MRWIGWLIGAGAMVLSCGLVAFAHDPDAPDLDVPEVTVEADRPVAASSQQFIPDKEYLLQPQGRPAQVLRLIPGFIAVEHSGGAGKADQYFLRGFDADHGTDVAFFADGMPINLRSHAHGQGYTDLNFIIPETIEGLDVYKGAYLPEYGDFSTAGAVNFRTREVVKEGVVQSAGGQFHTQRHLLMVSPTTDRVRSLIAAEGYYTNGPFEHDNRYFRGNLLGKATMNPSARSELSVTGTFHKSQWNASGEIPLRAVQDGSLDRFGAVDPSEGGRTMRSTGRLNYHYERRQADGSSPMPMRSTIASIFLRILRSSRTIPSTATGFSSPIGGSCMAEISDTNRTDDGSTWTAPPPLGCKPGSITSMRGSGRKCSEIRLGARAIRISPKPLTPPSSNWKGNRHHGCAWPAAYGARCLPSMCAIAVRPA